MFQNKPILDFPVKALYQLAALSLLFTLFFVIDCGIFSGRAALAATFGDTEGHWAGAEIEKALAGGYVKGYPNGLFMPDSTVTRAEFVSMLDSAFEVPDSGGSQSFKDVSASDWFADAVSSAVASGIAGGYPDGSFMPQKAVTRQEAACMLAKLLQPGGNGGSSFSDATQIGSWARASVTQLVYWGIMSGYPDGTFQPERNITRAEAVVIINKAIPDRDSTPAAPPQNSTTTVAPSQNSTPAAPPQNSTTTVAPSQNSTPAAPPQMYKITAGVVSDFLAINLWGTSTLRYQTQSLADPTSELAFDFQGFTLASSLKSWQQQINALGVDTVQLSQYQPDVVRLAAKGTLDIDATFDSSDGGCQMVIRLRQATNKQAPNPNNGLSASGGTSPTSNGASFYGMDLAAYPGYDAMQAWWNDSPFYYTGFYLGPSPYHPDASFMDKRQVLASQGWGLLPVYVGRQDDSDYLNAPTGVSDADNAAALAASAGFPPQTSIFLDIEASRPLTVYYLSYVTAWINELQNKGYQAGIYCNVVDAAQIRGAVSGNIDFWIAHYICSGCPSSIPKPSDSGSTLANTWQFAGDVNLSYGGQVLDIDLNTSIYTDPSLKTMNLKK
jgi:hypothetical protein